VPRIEEERGPIDDRTQKEMEKKKRREEEKVPCSDPPLGIQNSWRKLVLSVSLKAPHSWSIENIDDEKLATSSEFDCRKTTSVIDVFKLELLVSGNDGTLAMTISLDKVTGDGHALFTFSVEIDPADSSLHLVEANVVEPFEASTGYRPHPVIGYEEVFLPPHEDVLALREILVGEVRSLRLLSQRTPRRESSPVVHIGLLRRSPCFMACLEGVLCPDYLALEEGCQCRMVFRQA